VDFASRLEQRSEEPQALDVIGVEMGEQDIDPTCVDQSRAQPPDTRTCIENKNRIAGGADLDAGSVSAVCNRFGARTGQRAASTPEADLRGYTSQKRATAPR
jgi:hypothetical protein